MNRWQRWLDEATDSASARSVADLIGRSHTTVGRWMHGPKPPGCTDIIAIARTFDADPIEGMVAAGWLKQSDFTVAGLRSALGRAPVAMLAEELHTRLSSGRYDSDIDDVRRMYR